MKRFLGCALMAIACLLSCTKLDKNQDINASIAGYAQKGQFIKGSTITAYALNEQLVSTGVSFPSSISDDLGAFTLKSTVSAPYLELRAEGYYFNENLGEISSAPIYLNALTSSTQKEVNINLLTTFVSGRIKTLIAQGNSFEQAKSQAEKELLRAFTGSEETYGISGMENLNISEDGDGNAILLAVSCLMQQGRNPGEIQSLIARIASEFEQNGSLTSKILDELRLHEGEINVLDIMSNLTQFYEEKGLKDYKIPPFHKFIQPDRTEEFRIVTPVDVVPSGSYNYTTVGGKTDFQIISLHPFTVESDAEWLTFEKSDLVQYYYGIKEIIAPNEGMEPRFGKLTFKSATGEVLYTREISQAGNGQKIYLEIAQTKVSPGNDNLREGDRVNVNGEIYHVIMDQDRDRPYVCVKKSVEGYAVSAAPDLIVPAANGDITSATITYPSVVNEYLWPSNDNIIEISSVSEAQDLVSPFFGYYQPYPGSNTSDPVVVRLVRVCSLVQIRYATHYPTLSKIVMECNEEACLSGAITFSLGTSEPHPAPTFTNGSQRITVINTDLDNEIRFLVHPENLRIFKVVEAYDKDGKLVPISLQLEAKRPIGFNQLVPIDIR